MSYPWIYQANFEQAFATEWDVAESDTGGMLDRAHYSDLAGVSGQGPLAPWRGSYCMRVTGYPFDTNDHTVGDDNIDIADTATAYFAWYLFASSDFTASADDTFNIFELQQAGGATIEMSVGMRVVAATNALDIGIGDGVAPTSFVSFPRGRWVCVELLANVETGGAGDMELFLDGGSMIALSTLTQAAAVGRGVLGTQNTLTTTSGTLLFDEFIMDDARIFPRVERFPHKIRLYKSAHVFIGPGWINDVSIVSTTGTCSLYDTDTAYTSDASAVKVELDTTGQYISWDEPVYFERGCYASIGGTNPQVEVNLQVSHHEPGQFGPRYHWSDGAIRRYGQLRLPRPLNA